MAGDSFVYLVCERFSALCSLHVSGLPLFASCAWGDFRFDHLTILRVFSGQWVALRAAHSTAETLQCQVLRGVNLDWRSQWRKMGHNVASA